MKPDNSNIRIWFTHTYDMWVSDYKAYLEARGYEGHINDWFFIKRGFIQCWFEPGFHRFWQIWNPGLGYFTYKIYISMGGNQRKNLWTILTFLISGLVHNIVVIPFVRRWDFPLPFTFLCFGLFTIGFRWLDGRANLNNLPRICNLLINIALVIVSFEIGFQINSLLFDELLHG